MALSLHCVPSSVGDSESKKCDATSLKEGDVLSRLSYYVVTDLPRYSGDRVGLRRIGDKCNIRVPIDVVESECFSTCFDNEVFAPMTEVVDWFHRAGDAVFQVVFTKANGDERTLVGHHIGLGGKDTIFGRTTVRELVVEGGELKEQERQVDCRTIKSVTYGNTRAVVGKRKLGSKIGELLEKKREFVDASKLEKDMVISRMAYYRVSRDVSDDTVQITNLRGKSWNIDLDIVRRECFSVQALSEEYGSQTSAVERMMGAGDKVFEVKFKKKDGSDRTMVAFNTGTVSTLGRSKVNELTVIKDAFSVQERQVDHRTVTSVTIGGTRFNVSKRKATSKRARK